jgi:phage baseplate assembly protein gpV
MPAINRQNISEHLLEKQLSLIGKSVKDALEADNWRTEWSWTEQNAKDLRKYAIPLIRKTFKCNNKKVNSIYDFFLLNFGIKVNEHDKW